MTSLAFILQVLYAFNDSVQSRISSVPGKCTWCDGGWVHYYYCIFFVLICIISYYFCTDKLFQNKINQCLCFNEKECMEDFEVSCKI